VEQKKAGGWNKGRFGNNINQIPQEDQTGLNDVKEEVRNLKALLNQNDQNGKKPHSTYTVTVNTEVTALED
jgi:hypothetical protein